MLLEPVVQAILAERERIGPALSPELHQYLDEPVHRRQWYPTAHLISLLRAIVDVLMPGEPDEQAFQYFGMVAAQRDLFGQQALVLPRMQTEKAGAFSGVIDASQDVETMLRRAFGMWLIYHDAGEFVLKRTGEHTLSVVQEDYPLASEESCFMVRGYAREVMRMAETPGRFEKLTCRGRVDARCEWELTFDESVDVTALAAFE